MGTLRTKETEQKYLDAREAGALDGDCVLCARAALKSFKLWKVIKNEFPYDKIASVHDMIVPLRHVTHKELTEEELRELDAIKDSYIHPTYEWMFEATDRKKTIPNHFHIHLITS
ncbi:MAG: hypothetical protein ACYCZ0_01440 [Minisyncoccota bacterium]